MSQPCETPDPVPRPPVRRRPARHTPELDEQHATSRTPPDGWAVLDSWMHEIDLTDTTYDNALNRFNYASKLGLSIGLTSVVPLDPDIPEDRLAFEVMAAAHDGSPGAVCIDAIARYLAAVAGRL